MPRVFKQASIQENVAVLREQASLRSSVFKFTEQDFQRLMPKIVDHMDEPLADSSLVASGSCLNKYNSKALNVYYPEMVLMKLLATQPIEQLGCYNTFNSFSGFDEKYVL